MKTKVVISAQKKNKKQLSAKPKEGIEKDNGMRKIIWIILACLCLGTSCVSGGDPTPSPSEDVPRGGFFLVGTVRAIDDRIEIAVTEGDYAEGIFWVLTANTTEYRDAQGRVIDRDALAVGDTVQVEYGGQMMMSYPPQIVAARIVKQ